MTFLNAEVRQVSQAADRAQREIYPINECYARLIADIVTGKLDVRGFEPPTLDNALYEASRDDVDDIEEIRIKNIEL